MPDDEDYSDEDREPQMMPYKDALDLAIFCINTFMHPDGSAPADVASLEMAADDVILTLADLRVAVSEMGHA